MTKIKAIYFDLDGTLLNRDASLRDFLIHQYNRFQLEMTSVSITEYIERFIMVDQNGYVWKDVVYQKLVSTFHLSHINPESLLDDYLLNFQSNCVPYPNLINMLNQIKQRGLGIGLISNGFGTFQMNNVKALGIEHYFDTILISEWEGMKKPNPKLFLRACDRLNVLPQQSIYVGDHIQLDVHAAKNVGMNSVWKQNSLVDAETVDADWVIRDLLDLISILNQTAEQMTWGCTDGDAIKRVI